MAGRIQGITVEIGGDTTKLQTALKGVNTEIRNTQSQLRDVDKLLKLDPGNTELLAQKHRLLGDAVKETKEKLETLKTAAEQAEQALKDGTITQDQYDGLQREIQNCCEATTPLGRLIMNLPDIEKVCQAAPQTIVIASHLDSVNHALLTRKNIIAFANERSLSGIRVPEDGESIVL